MPVKPISSEPPLAIIITQGVEVIQANGGLWSFMHHFTDTLNSERYWLHKSVRGPVHEIDHVYLVICNRVYGRCLYGGWEGSNVGCDYQYRRTVTMRSGDVRFFPWAHMILAGPLQKAPCRIEMRGFQGFRYLHQHLW